MNGRSFVDTNVLVYAAESSEASKAEKARELVKREQICLSTQILGEFYRAVTSRRRQSPLSHREAVAWVQLWKRLEVHGITLAHVDLALEVRDRYDVDYYDALVVAAARLAECAILYSEDLSHGQVYGGVRVEDPFGN